MPKSYQLKITLLHLKPAIWRRFVVPAELKLNRIHDVIQIVMGWSNSHLHLFSCGEQRFSARYEPGDLEELNAIDESKVRLCELLHKKNSRLQYDYDFGDGWEHEITLERILPLPKGAPMQIAILDGEKACPLEDCGGPFGYANLVAAFEDPDHPERKDLLEWAGRDLDPDHLDLARIKAALERYQKQMTPRKRR